MYIGAINNAYFFNKSEEKETFGYQSLLPKVLNRTVYPDKILAK